MFNLYFKKESKETLQDKRIILTSYVCIGQHWEKQSSSVIAARSTCSMFSKQTNYVKSWFFLLFYIETDP